MNTSFHDLAIFHASAAEVAEAIVAWFDEHGFVLETDAGDRFLTGLYPGWGAMGITDRQTPRRMEIILQQAGEWTAVSVCHHTTRLGCLVGVVFGRILENEVLDLIESLSRQCPGAHL